MIVTDIDDAKLARANEVISVEEAKEKGVELIYVNTAKMDDPVDGLKALSVDGKGFDDVFVYVPARPVAELGNKILGWMYEPVCRTNRLRIFSRCESV